MSCSVPATFRTKLVLLALTVFLGAEAQAIEMFTFFGDGSRIGLPSLEVPIEAYPGIPLRRDRMRGRRRSMRTPPTTATPAGPSRAITIRTMTPPVMPEAPVIEAPRIESASTSPYGKTPRVPADVTDEPPMPPEPVDMPPSP